jgi:F420H(2)-dependent quinone reductase
MPTRGALRDAELIHIITAGTRGPTNGQVRPDAGVADDVQSHPRSGNHRADPEGSAGQDRHRGMTLALMSFLEDKVLPQVLRAHDAVYRNTNGWIGHRALGVPSLLLHTVGAKSAKPRTLSLSYARDGDDYLVVASKGGDPKAPGWYHNLKANPNVDINIGPKRFGVTARPVLPGDPDYDRMWRIVNKNNSDRYTAYQKKTSRPIPVVVLTPRQ